MRHRAIFGHAIVLVVSLQLTIGCTGIGVRERTEAPTPPAAPALASAGARAPILLTSASPATSSLSVMTYNLKHRESREDLGAMAQSLRSDLQRTPDIILCQEVMFDSKTDHAGATLASMLAYQCRGTKRTSDREGLAILSRYPFAHYEERHLDAQTSRLLLGFRRVSVMGEFLVPGIGRVRAVNVHFTNWSFEQRIRRKQIQETIAWITERDKAAPAALTLFGGDFNAARDGEEMQWLKSQLPSQQVVFQDFNSEAPSFGRPGKPRIRLDYIFVAAPRTGVNLLEERMLWKEGLIKNGDDHFFPSDHVAIVHRYGLKPAAGFAVSSVAE